MGIVTLTFSLAKPNSYFIVSDLITPSLRSNSNSPLPVMSIFNFPLASTTKCSLYYERRPARLLCLGGAR